MNFQNREALVARIVELENRPPSFVYHGEAPDGDQLITTDAVNAVLDHIAPVEVGQAISKKDFGGDVFDYHIVRGKLLDMGLITTDDGQIAKMSSALKKLLTGEAQNGTSPE